jgi:hypothetical protein
MSSKKLWHHDGTVSFRQHGDFLSGIVMTYDDQQCMVVFKPALECYQVCERLSYMSY